jgi:hypothetical protein
MNTVSEKQLARKHFRVGWQLYMSGLVIDSCKNADQRRGFMAALEAEADAETAAYLQSHTNATLASVASMKAA